MAETATIVGGGSVSLYLTPTEVSTAQAALFAAAGSNTESVINTSLSEAPTAGVYNVYELTPTTSGQEYTMTPKTSTVVLEGSTSVYVREPSSGTGQLIIGNAGNDTISAAGASETIIAGGGNNRILTTGNDTITVGSGNDTVFARGAATVYGGAGQLHLKEMDGGTIHSGSGSETIVGGTGTLDFFGSRVSTSSANVHGGSGINFFQGGAGQDTLVSGSKLGASSDTFEFASSVSGGTHVIRNFSTTTDQIDLKGYSQSDISSFKDLNGSTYIKLDDGTSITVRGAALTEGDIKFTH